MSTEELTIADKIVRAKNDYDEVYAKGIEVGKAQGGNTEEAYNQGFEAGKQAEWNGFWDIYQSNGNRTSYEMAFKSGYWGGNFKPKYDINVIDGAQAFYAFGGFAYTVTGVTYDLAAILEECGVTLDTSECTNFTNFYSYGSFSRVPTTDVTGTIKSLTGLAGYCRKLKTFDKLILKDDGSNTFSDTFKACISLTDIVIEGVIGANISFADSSKLTIESLQSIINALKTLGEGETKTLTLHATAKAKLTETDIATITQKGWTLA